MRNEIKLKFIEPEYIVDETNKIVVCKLTFFVLTPPNVDERCYPFRRMITVKSIARTCENDTFDINIGKKVSLAKAEQKAYAKTRKMCISKLKELSDVMAKLIMFCDKSFDVCDHNENYLKQF